MTTGRWKANNNNPEKGGGTVGIFGKKTKTGRTFKFPRGKRIGSYSSKKGGGRMISIWQKKG